MRRRDRKRRKRMRRIRRILTALGFVLIVVAAVWIWSAISGDSRPEKHPSGEDVSMEKRIMALYEQNCVISAGTMNSAWIDNGKVTVIGRNDKGQCETGEWSDVAAIALGDEHIVGLTEAGTLVFAGDNSYGQCDLDAGDDRVVSIAASSFASYAVLENGSVIMSGSGSVKPTDLEALTNVATISAGNSHAVVLHKDGKASAIGADVAESQLINGWEKLVAVACGYNTTVALDAKGRVYVAGGDLYGQRQLDGMDGVVNIAAGGNFCLAIEENGNVQGAGSNSAGQCEVGMWTDVRAVSCGYMHAIAISENGERMFSGSGQYGQQE